MKEFLTQTGYISLDKRILVHDYKDFKKTDWGKEQIEKYLDRWSKLGFVEGLEGETKERCALGMEQLAQFLIFQAAEDDSINAFETIGFPMIRRIIAGSINSGFKSLKDPDLFKFETFIKYCRELDVRKLEDRLIELVKPFHAIDAEAEAVVLCCEVIIDKFNGEEKSFDESIENYITKIKNRLKDEGTSSDNTNA